VPGSKRSAFLQSYAQIQLAIAIADDVPENMQSLVSLQLIFPILPTKEGIFPKMLS